jgi:hypothetical protein
MVRLLQVAQVAQDQILIPLGQQQQEQAQAVSTQVVVAVELTTLILPQAVQAAVAEVVI